MKKTLLALLLLTSINTTFSQNYFKPVPGGLENVNDGGDYYKVEIKDKSEIEIYNALLAMCKDSFNGDEDEITETEEGTSIRAKGVIKRYVCSKKYDVRFDVEFKIKAGRYIFLYNKFNIINPLTNHRIVFQKGSNFLSNLSSENGDDGKTYMFNKKEKMVLDKSCYKEIIYSLDLLGSLFDLSDDFEKYDKKSKKNNSDW